MKFPHFFFVSLIGILVLIPARAQSGAGQLRWILDSFQRTFAGENAGDRLSSVIIRGTQRQGGIEYDFVLRKKEPDSIRFRLGNGSASIAYGFNGVLAWERIERDGTVEINELTGDRRTILLNEADFYGPLLSFDRRQNAVLELLGTKVVNAQTAFKIRVERSGKLDAFYYIGAGSYYLLRRELLDVEGEVVLRTDYSDHRLVEGFPFAFTITNIVGDQQESVTEVETVIVNPGQLNFYFDKPTY